MHNRLLLVLVAALFAAPAASAASGGGSGQDFQASPLPAVATTQPALVDGPTPAALPPGLPKLQVPIGSVSAAGCGACITTCWTGTARGGAGDWSGHVYIFQHLYWCGNGAVVTYASAWQSYEQAGWYRLSSTGGPWWTGGGIGQAYQRVSGNVLWEWSTPLVNFHSTGTSNLDSTMWAYGAVSF
jgi:hypothetical protein